MENVNIVLAANLQNYRKKAGLTQEELAEKLGVTFQAVSKWENAKSAPDIQFLPMLADLFGCYIDELFSREIQTEVHYDHCPEFPWNDDDVIRGVVCRGKKILTADDNVINRFTFEWKGDAMNVKTHCNLSVEGSVGGRCVAGDNCTVQGNVTGPCTVGDNLSVGGNLVGGVHCGDNLDCKGNIMGGISCDGNVDCKGNIRCKADITCEKLTASGDVTAERINGNVTGKNVQCKHIYGDITKKP